MNRAVTGMRLRACSPPVSTVGQYFRNDYPHDLDHRNGQQRAGNAQQQPANQNGDEDHQRIELDGVAVNHRLEDAVSLADRPRCR